ncbi:class I adenylate-forming enzyme family protein [Rhodoferax sp.]|uniref:class I adenylate-forming enzyme family protein n=1 Tax=Rhodoferax sp. TaxID=50421 RepID=UPI00260C3854|nr:class I adenylate-forming enzyme family protein [Rhodoferax sp.]MDD3937613.1 class I adenylate-forming enzyme family protein [Rhodoferax sp.]
MTQTIPTSPAHVGILDSPGLFNTDFIARNAKYFGKKDAVVCNDQRRSWAEFHLRTNQVANALLTLGLNKGDKVCIIGKNSISMFEMCWGTIKAGGVIVPLNVMMSSDTLALMINNSDARLLFVDSETRQQVEAVRHQLQHIEPGGAFAFDGLAEGWSSAEQLIENAPNRDPDVTHQMSEPMNIIYSSGTTGIPKGIEHTHFSRLAFSMGYGQELLVDKYTRTLCSTPLYTNGTWLTMLPTIYSGGTCVLMSGFDAETFLETVARERCTHTFMVPTQAIKLIAASRQEKSLNLSSMQVILSGGQALPGQTFDDLLETFPNAGIYECYGMTEGFYFCIGPKDYEKGKRGSVGVPIFGADICIIDENGSEVPRGEFGEIAGYGAGLMRGYYNDAERTKDIVWIGPKGRTYIRSGDLGRMDEDGFLYVTGRIKDMIKSGGINIFASDIEDIFMRHPQVREVAVIGVPHEKWIETPLLLAIMHEGATISEAELCLWGNERLGKFQRVSRVEFRQDFPRANYGKVLKRELRDEYRKQQATASES